MWRIFHKAGFIVLLLPALASSQQFRQPESAVYDMPRERYLISNYYNGQLIAVYKDGSRSLFAEGKNSSAGLHIIDDTVYVGCGSEGVLAYNLVTGEAVMDIEIPGSVLLNDITSDTSGTLYVSDPYGNKIYTINLSDRTYSVLVNYVYWPNGLLFDKRNNRLLACTSTDHKIRLVDMNDGTLTELVDVGTGHLDGLAEDNAGNIYVSAQGPEAVYRYNSDFTSARELVSSGHDGPADIYYNKWDEVLVVPNISGNTVDFVDMPVPPSLNAYSFSDDAYGDGDGVPESGEEIELTFTFENLRPEDMINTIVTFFTEDISLTVTNGTVILGDLAPEQTVDNTSDPMRFTVPADYNPRLDSFYLEFSYTFMGNEKRDTAVILQGIGYPPILLVDDFAGEEIAEYYEQELENILVPGAGWDIEAEGTPLPGELSEYEVVIWFTGTTGSDLMDNDKIASIQGFLDNGGDLFLTGQGIAAEISSLNSDFLNDYLRCQHVSTYYAVVLTPAATAQVFLPKDTIMISGGDGASNQFNMDHISAVNGGVEEMIYLSTANCGAVSYCGDYKLVFFGFGFEAIRSDYYRFSPRDTVLSRILDLFEFQYPNSRPTASALTISPGDPAHMTDHTPEISWSYYDGDMTPQEYYQIQVGDDDDWLLSEMWDNGPVPGSETIAVYSGSELMDGTDYFIRARLSDGSLWSDWIYGAFHMNMVPVPVGLTPNNGEYVYINPPLLSHATMYDDEDDTLVYDYQLFDDAEMTVVIEEESGIEGQPGDTTGWQVETILTEYEDYYWHVRCRDAYEAGPWSELASFEMILYYLCGDADGNLAINVADAVYIINYIFRGGPAPEPAVSGDVNCDGTINVSDAVFLITYIFKGGPPPVEDCCP